MHLQEAVQELKTLNIFESIQVELDEAKGGRKDETDITITVKERSWRNLHMGATTDGNEETAVSSIEPPRFGRLTKNKSA
jgi:outer membrane protein insertion porin family